MNTPRQLLAVTATLIGAALSLVSARPAAAQFSVRADSGAAFVNGETDEISNTPGATATSSISGYSGRSTGSGSSESSVGRGIAHATISQPAAGIGGTVDGVNAYGQASFTDALTVGGAPGTSVTLVFRLVLDSSLSASSGIPVSIGAFLQAAGYGGVRGSCAFNLSATGETTAGKAFTLVVPAGSRVSLSANVKSSASTPKRSGSTAAFGANIEAQGDVYIEASAPITSDSGHDYSPATP